MDVRAVNRYSDRLDASFHFPVGRQPAQGRLTHTASSLAVLSRRASPPRSPPQVLELLRVLERGIEQAFVAGDGIRTRGPSRVLKKSGAGDLTAAEPQYVVSSSGSGRKM